MSGGPYPQRYITYPKDTIRVGDLFDTNRTIQGMEQWFTRAARQMKVLGITQEDLMPLFKVTTRGAVGHYLTGRRDPPISVLVALADRLDLSLDDLLRGGPSRSQFARLNSGIVLHAANLTRETLKKLGKPYVGPEADPELFAETLRLAIMGTTENDDGERGIRTAIGPGGRTTGTKGKTKAGDAKGSSSGGKRKRA